VTANLDPRQAQCFRFLSCDYSNGEINLRYAFDEDAELIERIIFPHPPTLPDERKNAFESALRLLHLIAGVSYYKAGVTKEIRIEKYSIDKITSELLEEIYFHGLGEFAYQNKMHLKDRIRFPYISINETKASKLGLPRHTLIPIGGGKDSLVTVELLKKSNEPSTAVWIGNSGLIANCALQTDLPQLCIQREISPILFEYNKAGAWNGHIPVTAINSAILVVAAILYGYDAIAFSNEHSASSATLEYNGMLVNHQWSKGFHFEKIFHGYVHRYIAADLDYFSLLRPWSEIAVTKQFSKLKKYHSIFSSCNRNFRLLGPKPTDRWCGLCPKCHFVFLVLAPFMAKTRLLTIFGRNFLDDESLISSYNALLEYREHKPFECVGEGKESRAALFALTQRAEWREDAIVLHFSNEILPQLNMEELDLEPLLAPHTEYLLPARLHEIANALG